MISNSVYNLPHFSVYKLTLHGCPVNVIYVDVEEGVKFH